MVLTKFVPNIAIRWFNTGTTFQNNDAIFALNIMQLPSKKTKHFSVPLQKKGQIRYHKGAVIRMHKCWVKGFFNAIQQNLFIGRIIIISACSLIHMMCHIY